ncbi:hypothetical protein MH050_03390 [Bacillus licheniformis]|uniref:hypothetical protein n=1 Tax=Bacillus TaxID=1386 RepID=UPI0011AB1E3D|nr:MULTISPECIES: hypothetical protein [Bacillus subtilis group]MCA1181408.1 hypothetical protein [Bacillus licheniformis]MCM3210463.1 hypothetical protein [Bacillus licheniformis]MCM3286069.1 hypothetical protein [Bacillus licheniformis]MCY7739891.1 hypothetical protein [Bacillus licheniformis]MEC2101952.1 hypothetical protein [Bacillus licheniformis]
MNQDFRNVRKQAFTMLSNTAVNDPELSLEAKGLLLIFLSNAPGWKIIMPEIISRSKNGRDAHYKVINELIKAGYFNRLTIREHGKVGKIKKTQYIFSDNKKDVIEETALINKELEEIYQRYQNSKKKKSKKKKKTPYPENQEVDKTVQTEGDRSIPENQDMELLPEKQVADSIPDNPDSENKEHENKGEALEPQEFGESSNNTNINRYIKETLLETSPEHIDPKLEGLMKKSLESILPNQIYNTLNVFCPTFNEMYEMYGILLRAKSTVSKKYNLNIMLEDFEEEIHSSLLAAIRKVKTDKSIKTKENYIYISLYNKCEEIARSLIPSKNQKHQLDDNVVPFYNWLEN